jgi:plastocyanin domain-containing protein
MDLTYRGYSPNVIFIKKDIPVRWIINVKQMSGCTDEIILLEYNIKKPLQYGENIIEFTPDRLGDIKFSCWMQMVWGKFVVTQEEVSPSQKQLELEETDLPQGTCKGGGSCGGGCAAAQRGGCGCSRVRAR